MPAPTGPAIIKAGSLLMTGAQTVIPLGFPADAVWLFLDNGATASEPVNWTQTAWCQRAQRIGTSDSIANVVTVFDTDLLIGTNALCNVAGATLHWIAVCDNGAGILSTTGWMGSPAAWSPTIGLNGGIAPAALMIERDASRAPCWWSNDLAAPNSIIMDGTGAVTDAVTAMNGDGTVSLGTRVNVNELSGGALGEGHDCIAFWQAAGLCQLVTWTGDGSINRTIPHTVANAAFAIVVPSQATVRAGFKWATQGSKMCHASSAVAFDNAVVSLSCGIVTGSDTRYNTAGQSYRAIVLGKQAGSFTPAVPKIGKAVLFRGSGSSYADCGSSDTLSFAGPRTIAWVIRPLPVQSAAPAYIIARSSASEGRADSDGLANGAGIRKDGTWSEIVALHRFADFADWAGPCYMLGSTNYNNYSDYSGSENSIYTKPWRAGILSPPVWQHGLEMHDGTGRKWLFIDGRLVKQRKIDMAGVTLSDDAGQRANIGIGLGYRTIIAGRWDGTSVGNLTRMAMSGVWHWKRMLSATEIQQHYRRTLLGDLEAADVPCLLGWEAKDVIGPSWPAVGSEAVGNTATLSNAKQIDAKLVL